MRGTAEWLAVVIAAVAWLFLLASSCLAWWLGRGAYLALAVLIIWTSVRYRRPGWIWGFLFGVSLLTLPIWVMGAA